MRRMMHTIFLCVMIDFQNISKNYGEQDILIDATFRINPGERVGIVGPNGAGKSTIFGLITGDIQPDQGNIVLPKKTQLGYVHQQLSQETITTSLLHYTENAIPEIEDIQTEMEKLETRFQHEPASKADLDRLGTLQSRFEHLGGYELRTRAETALSGLGFNTTDFLNPLNTFSGGWQMRAELARVLVARSDILLLDEPSNYLDIPAIEWMMKYLREFKGTLLLISHDRYLLNALTSITIQVANARTERYAGNYDYYIRERALRIEQREAQQKNQERKVEQLERFIERFRAKNTKASQVQSRIKMLEKMEQVDIPIAVQTRGSIRLATPPHCGNEIMRLENIGITYDNTRWIFNDVSLSIRRGDKTAVVGFNGMGKSTMLKVLAGELPPTEGNRVLGHKVIPGYQSQDFAETMNPTDTAYAAVKQVAPDVSEKEIRSLLGGFGFSGPAIDKQVSVLSGGEKIRLAFARLLIKPPNFLILDEPTTHLDIATREALEDALKDYQGTLVLVSHDIEFVRHVATSIIAITPYGVSSYTGDYDYYKSKITGLDVPQAKEQQDKPISNRKQQKRERAERLQAFSKRRRQLEKIIKEAETTLEKLEKEQKELLSLIESQQDGLDFADINQRLLHIQENIATTTETWETHALELEEAQQAFENGEI